MDDKQEYNYDELTGNLRKSLESLRIPELQAISENYRNMMSGIVNVVKQFYESEAVQAVGRLAKQMQTMTINLPKIEIPKIELPEETIRGFRKISCLRFLEKIQWPLYLLIDDDLMALLEPYQKSEDPNVDEISCQLLDFLDDEYISDLASVWKNKKSINPERISALEEAVKLFEGGFYYGCTALLSCQFEGLISDIYKMQTDAGRVFTADDLRIAYEHYNPDKKLNSALPMKSEKNQLLAMVSETDSGFFYWIAVVGYLYNIVLTSDEKMDQSNHPCRNKICHGIQLNYGTREHAVKAILTVDMTIKLGEDMKRILESSDTESKDDE